MKICWQYTNMSLEKLFRSDIDGSRSAKERLGHKILNVLRVKTFLDLLTDPPFSSLRFFFVGVSFLPLSPFFSLSPFLSLSFSLPG